MTGGFRRIAFDRVASEALSCSETVVRGLLPDGRREGAEWVARNPNRPNNADGSFKVNLRTGKWGDFARADAGGDLISLAAYVARTDQRTAALRLADSLGLDPYL